MSPLACVSVLASVSHVCRTHAFGHPAKTGLLALRVRPERARGGGADHLHRCVPWSLRSSRRSRARRTPSPPEGRVGSLTGTRALCTCVRRPTCEAQTPCEGWPGMLA